MKKEVKAVSVKVEGLLSDKSIGLDFTLIAGKKGLKKEIINSKIQRPGMLLHGYPEYLAPGSVLLLNNSELKYLNSVSPKRRKEILDKISTNDIVCIITANKTNIPKELTQTCNLNNIPLLSTSLSEEDSLDSLSKLLNRKMASIVTIHGVLMDVYGVGVLLLGGSGVGKSECALDLTARGHRLVSDDVIQIKKRADNLLIGSGPEAIRHTMELRGLGLINIKDLFGVTSIRYKKRIELVILMELWEKDKAYDRLGIDEEIQEILGIKIPRIRMPVAPGRNISILVEVAARNYLLKLKGYHAAREFVEEHDRTLKEQHKNDIHRSEEKNLE